jgi:hypothetical protein
MSLGWLCFVVAAALLGVDAFSASIHIALVWPLFFLASGHVLSLVALPGVTIKRTNNTTP